MPRRPTSSPTSSSNASRPPTCKPLSRACSGTASPPNRPARPRRPLRRPQARPPHGARLPQSRLTRLSSPSTPASTSSHTPAFAAARPSASAGPTSPSKAPSSAPTARALSSTRPRPPAAANRRHGRGHRQRPRRAGPHQGRHAAAYRDRGFVSAGPEGDWKNPAQFTRAVKGGVSSPKPTPSRRARPRCSTLYQFAITDSRFREVAAQRELPSLEGRSTRLHPGERRPSIVIITRPPPSEKFAVQSPLVHQRGFEPPLL